MKSSPLGFYIGAIEVMPETDVEEAACLELPRQQQCDSISH
jgi:hypothetical protein